MRLRHIEIFEAIRRTGSLTEAAAALHISQPAASKLLAHAEAQLGFKLFERVKGRLVATREAEILAPEVARLNQDLGSVRRLAASLRDRPHGHLRLGCAPALGLGLLPGVVRASRDAQPGITFDIHTHHSAELVQGLLAHELDLAITFDANNHPGLTRTSLGHTELVHLSRLPGAGTTRLQELGGETLIVLDAAMPRARCCKWRWTRKGWPPAWQSRYRPTTWPARWPRPVAATPWSTPSPRAPCCVPAWRCGAWSRRCACPSAS
ncbi:LysR family transcriptional regulator [Bordetella pertussis]|nr:LysR family transcriptional regulator [Bordetella pertussis]